MTFYVLMYTFSCRKTLRKQLDIRRASCIMSYNTLQCKATNITMNGIKKEDFYDFREPACGESRCMKSI